MHRPITADQEAAIRDFRAKPAPVRLQPGVQPYAWGSSDFIPALRGTPNPDGRPFAELWMGAHEELEAVVELRKSELPLGALIEAAPREVLGPRVAERFGGELPYLFKVLSAAVPLSVQAHPSKRAAEEGFARENAARIPLTASHRNYKDANHKPEILAALTDFYALRGFRPFEEIGQLLGDAPELRPVMPEFPRNSAGLRRLYQKLMTMAQPEVDDILNALVARLTASSARVPFDPERPEYWLLRADQEFSRDGHRDRGLFSILLLNLVHLRPGEALFLAEGALHAYLWGSGVELMANSNNVLRGGLTVKHVDVPELLANVSFDGEPAQVLQPTPTANEAEWVYPTPATEFELRRISTAEGRSFVSDREHGPDIVIVTDASASTEIALHAAEERMPIRRGDVLLVPAGVPYAIHTSAPVCLYRATV